MVTQTIPEIKAVEKNVDSAISYLFQLGREKSYVTFDDIRHYFPHPEDDLDQLDRVFACLLCAGIPFGADKDHLCLPINDRNDMDECCR